MKSRPQRLEQAELDAVVDGLARGIGREAADRGPSRRPSPRGGPVAAIGSRGARSARRATATARWRGRRCLGCGPARGAAPAGRRPARGSTVPSPGAQPPARRSRVPMAGRSQGTLTCRLTWWRGASHPGAERRAGSPGRGTETRRPVPAAPRRAGSSTLPAGGSLATRSGQMGHFAFPCRLCHARCWPRMAGVAIRAARARESVGVAHGPT